ncbi:hypothetical protein PARC_p0067 (plasmid) [Pseudoalteromonas arctica A 37-1-2]|uniref:Uncharacterized protein n=1 Tax=Pseudoalteromonas arctica A 37-1-2 TaxID=1117313 RepID=A0A290SC73_9GAMM|nr:hypothetical protein PARC_p0067 [Pseudoalteromonas arctica A 37-1-2]
MQAKIRAKRLSLHVNVPANKVSGNSCLLCLLSLIDTYKF